MAARIILIGAVLLLGLFIISQTNDLTSVLPIGENQQLVSGVSPDEDETVYEADISASSDNGSDDNEDEEGDEGEGVDAATSGRQFYVTELGERVRLWKWTQTRCNILYVKVPKTGGTTLADNLVRLAKHSNWVLGKPNVRSRVITCLAEKESETNWNYMVTANGGRIGIFASHACYRPFMRNKKYWSLKRSPRMITVMRNPWDQFISKYRFAQVCCDRKDWKWCEDFCPMTEDGSRTKLTHTRYAEIACKSGRCNEQRYYMGSGTSDKILEDYKVVLILERFDEGLAMLAVILGLPFQSLPYLRENTNNAVKMPNFTMEYRKQVHAKYLSGDSDLYNKAIERFDQQISTLSSADKVTFNQTLTKLKATNELLATNCWAECGHLETLTKPRKLCDNTCIEKVFDSLMTESTRIRRL